MNRLIKKIAQPVNNVVMFYVNGFRSMTVGKVLWTIILIKLFILFFILKLFFFPNILSRDYSTDEERAEHVRQELTKTFNQND